MFRRRKSPTFHTRFADLLWPRIGFRRSTRYLMHRLSRLPGTPYALAAGFACGASVSFTPFVGLHFVLAAAFAWLIRANVLASLIGTAVGNPWTFPFIWVWLYEVGTWFGVGGTAMGEHTRFTSLFADIFEAVLHFDFSFVFEKSWPIFGPMLVASIPTAAVVWATFFFLLRPAVEAYHHRRLTARVNAKRKSEERRTEMEANT